MDFVYTKHHTPRGARPDAEVGEKVYLIKNTLHLRLTYQIKVLAYMAQSRNKKLIIRLPKDAKIHPSLKEFVSSVASLVKIERN